MLGLGSGINRLSAAEAAAIAGRIPGFTGLLDESYGSGAAAAYSVRQLSSSETTAMVIRRDSDNQETSIGFDSNGNLDESAIETFCSGTTCKVSEWRDQSGNRNHAVQTTAANQPTIYTGGAIVKVDGRPAFTVDGSNDNFNVTALTGGQYGIFTVGKPTSLVGYYTDSTTGSRQYILRNNTGYTINGSFNIYNSGTQTTQLFNNQKELVSFLSNSTTSNYINKLLTRTSETQSYAGDFSEFIIYTSDKSTDRTSIESNIGDYFTQNTPLLDTYTGAAGAYSLRKLSSSYSGAAIRVRRDNDNLETDINFNIFGELDTVSLAAHCGSNNGYVTNWYDQSSNSNTARQTNASYQPKIYDATTGVITENGKPSVEFDGVNDRMTSTASTGSDFTTSVVLKALTASQSNQWLLQDTSGADMLLRHRGANYDFYDGATTHVIGTAGTTQHHIFITANSSGSVVSFDSVDQSISGIPNNGYTDLEIGADSGSRRWHGRFQEIVIWDGYQASNRTDIEDNLNTFYSIY
jgi:hypothetical protein